MMMSKSASVTCSGRGIRCWPRAQGEGESKGERVITSSVDFSKNAMDMQQRFFVWSV
jgi:hypothetical protein